MTEKGTEAAGRGDEAVAVYPALPELSVRALALAERLALPFTPQPEGAALLLVVAPERLELRETGRHAAGPVYVDFLSGSAAHRRQSGGKGQALARAVGLKGGQLPSVLDATAGLGGDAFVLASLGLSVRLAERSKVVGALLSDGLERASAHPETAPAASRLHLTVADAAEVMAGLAEGARPDTVYLDPMYPHTGKTALKNKEMRLFRLLVGEDEDAPRLLAAALSCAKTRVVVKRPKNAPPVGELKPSATIPGKTTRFDLYLI